MSARCIIAFVVVNAFSRSAPADRGPPIIATVAMLQRPQPGGHHPVLAAGPLALDMLNCCSSIVRHTGGDII